MRDPRDIVEDMRNEKLNKTRIELAKYKDTCATQLKSLAKANRKEEQQAARIKELERKHDELYKEVSQINLELHNVNALNEALAAENERKDKVIQKLEREIHYMNPEERNS